MNSSTPGRFATIGSFQLGKKLAGVLLANGAPVGEIPPEHAVARHVVRDGVDLVAAKLHADAAERRSPGKREYVPRHVVAQERLLVDRIELARGIQVVPLFRGREAVAHEPRVQGRGEQVDRHATVAAVAATDPAGHRIEQAGLERMDKPGFADTGTQRLAAGVAVYERELERPVLQGSRVEPRQVAAHTADEAHLGDIRRDAVAIVQDGHLRLQGARADRTPADPGELWHCAVFCGGPTVAFGKR